MKKIFFMLAVLVLMGPACPRAVEPPPVDIAQILPPGFAGAPGLQLQTPDGLPLPEGALKKEHTVGASPCPDPLPPLVIAPTGDWPPGEIPTTAVPETDTPWLDLPSEVEIGQPFTPKFNCRISDRSRHAEEADVLFRIEGHIGAPPEDSVQDLEVQTEKFNLPVDVVPLKIRLEVR